MRNLGIALCEMALAGTTSRALVGATSREERRLRDLIWNLALDEVESAKFSDEEVRGIRRVMRGIR